MASRRPFLLIGLPPDWANSAAAANRSMAMQASNCFGRVEKAAQAVSRVRCGAVQRQAKPPASPFHILPIPAGCDSGIFITGLEPSMPLHACGLALLRVSAHASLPRFGQPVRPTLRSLARALRF